MRRVGRVPLRVAVSTLMSGRDITFYLRNGFDSNVVRLPDDGLFLAVGNLNFSSAADGYIAFFEGGQATTLANIEHGIKHTAGGGIRVVENGVEHANDLATYTTGTDYDLVIAYRNNETQYFWRETADDIFALLWVSSFTAAVTDVYAEATNTGVWSTGIENFGRMPETSLAPTTENTGVVPTSTADNAPDGDVTFEFGITTLPSAGSVKLRVRKQDATNYWEIEYDNSGNYKLNEIVGGTPSTRISGVTVLSGGEIGQLRLSGNEAKLYYDETALTPYTSTHNFLRETAWELNSLGTGGVLSDLRVYKTHRQTEIGLGGELVTNGDFSAWTAGNPDDWFAQNQDGTNFVIESSGGGECRIVSDSTKQVLIRQGFLISGNYYNVTLDVIAVAFGQLQVSAGGTSFFNFDTVKSYDVDLIANTNLFVIKRLGVCDVTFDNVKVEEILFTPDSLNNQLADVIEA